MNKLAKIQHSAYFFSLHKAIGKSVDRVEEKMAALVAHHERGVAESEVSR